jgi:hypothetical protein
MQSTSDIQSQAPEQALHPPVSKPVERRWRAVTRRLFSFPVFLGALLIGPACLTLPHYPHDPDTWWDTVVGERILETGTWPTTESYSFTARGHEWFASEWLGEVVMGVAVRLGGLTGLTILRVALVSALLVLLYYYASLRSGNTKAGFVATVILFPLLLGFLWLRPQLLAYIFLAVTLISLERFRQGSAKALWILPLVFLLWVNTHGTFPLGLVIIGLYWVSGLFRWNCGGVEAIPWTTRQCTELLFILGLCALVLPLTPYGTRLAAYPLEFAYSHSAMITRLSEWQPLGFGETWGRQVLVVVLLFLLAQVLFRPRYRLEEIALLLFAIYATCVHRRFFLLFALVFAPAIATLLARWMPAYRPSKDRFILNAALVAILAGTLIWAFPSRTELRDTVDVTYPRKAMEYLRKHPHLGPMYNDYWFGGYLIWSLGNQHPVFIDGRADVYDYAGVYSDYFRITTVQPDALFLLHKYGVQSCLTGPGGPLAAFLAGRPDWKLVYKDKVSVIFVHSEGRASLGSGADRFLPLSNQPLGVNISQYSPEKEKDSVRAPGPNRCSRLACNRSGGTLHA